MTLVRDELGDGDNEKLKHLAKLPSELFSLDSFAFQSSSSEAEAKLCTTFRFTFVCPPPAKRITQTFYGFQLAHIK